MRIAAVVAKRKEREPGQYCPVDRCLWRTGGGRCPRHAIAPVLMNPKTYPAPKENGNPVSEANVVDGVGGKE